MWLSTELNWLLVLSICCFLVKVLGIIQPTLLAGFDDTPGTMSPCFGLKPVLTSAFGTNQPWSSAL